jgi:hypothetical protein
MRSFCTKTLALLAGLSGLTGLVHAQENYDVPSLLPTPMVQAPMDPYGYSGSQVQYQPGYQPSHQPSYQPAYTVAARSRQPGPQYDGGLPAPHHGEGLPGEMYPPPPSAPAHGLPSYEDWSGSCADGSCGYGDSCGDDFGMGRNLGNLNCWFVSAYGLAMTRDDSNPVWLSYDQADIDSALLSTRHAEMDWAGGFEIHAGRYFNCGQNAFEAVYWGLFPGRESGAVWAADTVGGLGSSLNFDTLEYDDGSGNPPVAVIDIYNNAAEHRICRQSTFHNVELNILGNPSCFSCGDNCCSRPSVQLGWLAGFRYFLFDENLLFAAAGDPYEVDVTNQLFGFQIGGAADYLVTQRLRAFGNVKFGLFGNSIDHHSQVYGDNGYATINNPGSAYDGAEWNIRSYKADVSFLGEINLGASFQLCSWARISGGYRGVALTGVALTTEQIPFYFGDVAGVRDIDSYGSLILHGAFGGLELNY